MSEKTAPMRLFFAKDIESLADETTWKVKVQVDEKGTGFPFDEIEQIILEALKKAHGYGEAENV